PPVLRLVQPVLSGILALVFLSQPVTASHLSGGVLTIVGVCGALLTPGNHRFARGQPPGDADPEPG
ncbi:MAG: hypothetical protein H0V19_08610, partial [Euzebyales bacterium]|nr:hypothetical protein [Euzebyales bacterium]